MKPHLSLILLTAATAVLAATSSESHKKDLGTIMDEEIWKEGYKVGLIHRKTHECKRKAPGHCLETPCGSKGNCSPRCKGGSCVPEQQFPEHICVRIESDTETEPKGGLAKFYDWVSGAKAKVAATVRRFFDWASGRKAKLVALYREEHICNWKGHCFGARCKNEEDCCGDNVCDGGKCVPEPDSFARFVRKLKEEKEYTALFRKQHDYECKEPPGCLGIKCKHNKCTPDPAKLSAFIAKIRKEKHHQQVIELYKKEHVCNLEGHCFGTQCQDGHSCCDGSICDKGKCVPDPDQVDAFEKEREETIESYKKMVTHTCNWKGHCLGNDCDTEHGCCGDSICELGKCAPSHDQIAAFKHYTSSWMPGYESGLNHVCNWEDQCFGKKCENGHFCCTTSVCDNGYCTTNPELAAENEKKRGIRHKKIEL